MQRNEKFGLNWDTIGLKSRKEASGGRKNFAQGYRFAAHCLLALCFVAITAMHPYFVGVTEIKIEPKSKLVSVSCKLFVDDVQEAIFQQTGQKINLSAKRPQDQVLLKNYLLSKLKIHWGNAHLPLTMLGYDIEEEGVWCYFESSIRGKAKSLVVCNRALYETLETQTHFLHVTYGTVKQHWKISNPEDCHTFGMQ